MTNRGENTILCQPPDEGDRRAARIRATESAPFDPDLLVLVGPTAVGKTAVAIEVAQRIQGEIVNADSMQVYRHMDIGTAKPTSQDRAAAQFHVIDIAEPGHQVTVSEWRAGAEAAIADIRIRGKRPILCGGTGLYIKALLENWKLAGTPAAPAIRSMLQAKVNEFGPRELHRELAEVDSVTASRLHPNDIVRVVRALEVYYATGITISEFQAKDRRESQPRPANRFGLTLSRSDLYERIEQRVDKMVSSGLEEEVRWLLDHGITAELAPMRSLGYKEMVQYVNGQLDHSGMLSAIKQSTRRYAKRQQTWFNADTAIDWIDVTALTSAEVASQIISRLETADANSTRD